MKVAITDLMGINATGAPLQLRGGEMSNAQNLRNRPWGNMAKRRGVESYFETDGPIMSILEFVLDDVTIPIIQFGGNMIVWPNLSTASGGENPNPYPNPNPLDPNGNNVATLFLIEPLMRTINERCAIFGSSLGIVWPNKHYDAFGNYNAGGIAPPTRPASDFYPGAGGVVSVPPNNFYQYDLGMTDIGGGTNPFTGAPITPGSPAGTYAAGHINKIIGGIGAITYSSYVKTTNVNGLSALPFYDATSLGIPAGGSATPANYKSVHVACRSSLQKLLTFDAPGSWVDVTGSGLSQRKYANYPPGLPTRAGAEANVTSLFNAAPFVDSGLGPTKECGTIFDGSAYYCTLSQVKGKLSVDLTHWNGSALIYIKFAADTSSGLIPFNPPFAYTDGTIQLIAAGSGGGTYLSDVYGDGAPPFFYLPGPGSTYGEWYFDAFTRGALMSPVWKYFP